jgi:competence protein ComFC
MTKSNHTNIQRTIKKNAKKILAFFFDLIWPKSCFGCGADGTYACKTCLDKINISFKKICFGCNAENDDNRICSKCKKDFFIDGCLFALNYEDPLVKKMVKTFKFGFIREFSEPLGGYLADLLFSPLIRRGLAPPAMGGMKEDFSLPQAILIPIPLFPRRERWRGFNQANLLSRKVSGSCGIAVLENKLRRTKNNKPQSLLGGQERKSNVLGAFGFNGEKLDGQTIYLVDDVITTGATLNECARILKENGAGEVWGLVVAKG